jgi:hypothetical protein
MSFGEGVELATGIVPKIFCGGEMRYFGYFSTLESVCAVQLALRASIERVIR